MNTWLNVSSPFFKLRNEDDHSEQSPGPEQPSTSTETAPASQIEATVPEGDASPPPYCSIAAEAAAAAAAGISFWLHNPMRYF